MRAELNQGARVDVLSRAFDAASLTLPMCAGRSGSMAYIVVWACTVGGRSVSGASAYMVVVMAAEVRGSYCT